jgi:hypothetical protein
MKTKRRGSQPGCFFRQAMRAALTSGRSCSAARVVFFIAQAQPVDPVPQGVESDLHPQLLLAALLHLAQRDVNLLGKPSAQEPVMALQAAATIAPNLLRSAMAVLLMLSPKPLHAAAADPEALGHLPHTFAFFPCLHYPLTQISTQWSHGHKDYLFRSNTSI